MQGIGWALTVDEEGAGMVHSRDAWCGGGAARWPGRVRAVRAARLEPRPDRGTRG